MPVRPLIDSLLLYDPNRSTSTANLWVAHPSPSEEAALGKLFMVISIDSTDRLNHEIISSLQEQMKRAYYQSTEPKFSQAFEQALHQTNQHLHRLVIEGVDGWLEKMHCVIGVIVNGQLILATAGSMIAYVLRRGRMHDILGPQSSSINPLKIFSNLLEGQLDDQDQLLVCTPTVLDYFSLEKLRRTMAEHTPAESVRQLETALLGSEQFVALAALVIQAEGQADVVAETPMPPREIGRPSTVAPQRSMDSLIARERATEQLLTPSIWPSLRDTVAQTWRNIRYLVDTKIFRRPARRTLPPGVSRPNPTAPTTNRSKWSIVGRFIFDSGRQVVRTIARTWRSAWLSFQRRQTRRELHTTAPAPNLPRASRSPLNRLVSWFSSLARRQRWIIGGVIGLVFILATTIVMTKGPGTSSNGKPTDLAAQIENHLNKAEAALLYGGEDTAQSEVQQASATLASLPTKTKSDRAIVDPLAERLEVVRTKLRRLVIVTNPEVVAQLAEVAPTLRPTQIYWSGSLIYSYDPGKQSGVLVDTATADQPTVLQNSIDTGEPITGAVTGTGLITFATAREGFVELNLTTAVWRPLDVAWPSGSHIVQGLSFFQNRLYALDRVGGEIFRFARSGTNLGTGVKWLKEPANLTSGRAIAVDGSIFILQPDGKLEEYFNGRRGDFSLASVDPALKNPTRLITSSESTKLYLVDPSNKRLVVFDKNGKLVRQYQSASWTSLNDITVSEATKSAIVLSGTTIYRINLQD